jgi:hypothetical protein
VHAGMTDNPERSLITLLTKLVAPAG